ncbi:hypothetical protein NPIL_275711 [Nephila pilipes]|uniref:Uncharacterized protein n=1 Tax=Nephila pilipes TaxID=299642 RepID=A0A8X6JNL9_NEPPI|nr:hypothetical protein NPIL_275711 [Nephila pilipes]
MNGRIVAFQSISSFVDLDGKERADLRVKRGTKSHMEEITIPLNSLKRCIPEKVMLNYNMDLSNKSWENNWKEFRLRPRKEAVAHFRLKTRLTAYQNT